MRASIDHLKASIDHLLKIGQLGSELAFILATPNHDVFRLQVRPHDALAVHVNQTVGHVEQDLELVLQSQQIFFPS